MEYKVSQTSETLDLNIAHIEMSSVRAVAEQDSSSSLEQIIAELLDSIVDNNRDLLIDIVHNHFPESAPTGQFNIGVLESTFVHKTKESILCSYKDEFLKIEVNASEFHHLARVIPFVDILFAIVDELRDDSSFYGTLSYYVESCLIQYEDISTWHCGYLFQDGSYCDLNALPSNLDKLATGTLALWFGPSYVKPASKWIIRSDEPISSAWYTNDVWQTIEYLVDESDEGFLIWYTGECCLSCPDLSEILTACPISLSEHDAKESIQKKMHDYVCRVSSTNAIF